MYTAIFQAMQQKQNVFITGAAGTGKSYMLGKLREDFPDIQVTASTGSAAVNVGGTTIHSFSGIGYGDRGAEEITADIHPGAFWRIRNCKRLAIDEVSMLKADIIELINEVFQKIRNDPQPFGGIQMIFIGDFLQLPPVQGDFAFESDAWKDAGVKIFCLSDIHRQSDQEFIQILHAIRMGKVSETDIDTLSRSKVDDTAVRLYARNTKADHYNRRCLNMLDGETVSFEALDEGDERWMEKCITPKYLKIKKDARVMLTINLDIECGLINGSLGTVVMINSNYIKVQFDNGVVRDLEQQTVAKLEVNKKIMAQRIQFPIRLAWAISIHKSQGMTIEKVKVDMEGIFESGQAYVALSRATTLNGLEVINFSMSHVSANKKAVEFMENVLTKND